MVTKTINLIVPRGWHELDDKQLRYLFGLLADDYSSAEIRTLRLEFSPAQRTFGANRDQNEDFFGFGEVPPKRAKRKCASENNTSMIN